MGTVIGATGKGGAGIRNVARLPAARRGLVVYLKRNQREAFTLEDFDLAFTAASLGNDNRIGFASAAGAAAYRNADMAAGALEGAAAGIAVFARREGSIEFIVTNALANQLGSEATIYVDGTAHAVPRQVLPPAHSVARAGMTLYASGGADLAAGEQWAVGDTPTIRIFGRNGDWIAPDGTLGKVGDENPAGDIVYHENFWHVGEDGEWTEGLGGGGGGVPAVRLEQNGNDALGLLIGLEREDAGADWTLDVIDGTGAIATTRVASGANAMVVRFPARFNDGNHGNRSTLNVARGQQRLQTEGSEGNRFIFRLQVPEGRTFAQVAAFLRATAQFEDADVTVEGDGTVAFPAIAAPGVDYAFAGGAGHTLEVAIDVDGKTVDLTYHGDITQQELLDFLDGRELDAGTFRATRIGDTNLGASPEAPPFAGRPFDEFYSGGLRPRRTPEGYTDPTARAAALAAQQAADAAGAAAATAAARAASKLGEVVVRYANSRAAFDQNLLEANGSGDVFLMGITGNFQDGFDIVHHPGDVLIWDQANNGGDGAFVQISASFETLVRLVSFDIADIASAAELATFLGADNNRSVNILRFTADFRHGGVDYKAMDLWGFDTSDGVLKLLLRPSAVLTAAQTAKLAARATNRSSGPAAYTGNYMLIGQFVQANYVPAEWNLNAIPGGRYVSHGDDPSRLKVGMNVSDESTAFFLAAARERCRFEIRRADTNALVLGGTLVAAEHSAGSVFEFQVTDRSGANVAGNIARVITIQSAIDKRLANLEAGATRQTEHIRAGWSADQAITNAELTESSDTDTVTLGTDFSGFNYLAFWRSDADGGDPTEVNLVGGGNSRNLFNAAIDRAYNGVAGKLIVSVARQNADLLGGEDARIV